MYCGPKRLSKLKANHQHKHQRYAWFICPSLRLLSAINHIIVIIRHRLKEDNSHICATDLYFIVSTGDDDDACLLPHEVDGRAWTFWNDIHCGHRSLRRSS